MREVAIIGVGMHRFGKFLDKSLQDLGRVAVWNAISDAGIEPRQIQAAYVGNSLAGLITGQEGVRGQVVLRDAGFSWIPVVNVEGACASGTIALREAWIAVGAGVCDVALALGVEKLYCDDTARSIEAIAADSDIELLGNLGFQFIGQYAMTLRKFMEKYGWTQLHLAKVTAKNKYNGSLNPYAQYQKAMTPEEILNSRVVGYPLTLYMCSTMADGAAAAIICTKDIARKYTSKPLVTISSCRLHSIPFIDPRESSTSEKARLGLVAYERIAKEAYEEAGIGPKDIDIAEVHDAMAPAELVRYVSLGFCEPEDVPQMVDEEHTSLSGTIPVNTSGGLAARGHPVGATGLGQIAELVWQLRGEANARQVLGRDKKGPKVALAQNHGGMVDNEVAASAITVLKR